MPQPTLATPRLVLRPFELADAADVQRLAGAREVADTTLTVPHPYPEGAAETWIARLAPAYQRGEEAVFAITSPDDGLIGAVGLALHLAHRRGDLGYWVGTPYWGLGYCTEAARAVLAFGFGELGLHRVFAMHFTRNGASGRVMRKLGMRHEGMLRHHLYKWDRPEDVEVYGILREEFDAPAG